MDLEIALHRILSRRGFSGPGHVHVSEVDDGNGPYHVVLIDFAAARVVADFFDYPAHLSLNSDPVIWTLGPEQAKTIVAASR